MRLWHYEMIPYLPKSQLVAQWRELNSIFKNQNKHILINYVYEYSKNDLYSYSLMIIKEMYKRNIRINSFKNFFDYFGITEITTIDYVNKPFKYHHTERYLIQCFYNLQEKYDRGQADFDKEKYTKLKNITWEAKNIKLMYGPSKKPYVSEIDSGILKRIERSE